MIDWGLILIIVGICSVYIFFLIVVRFFEKGLSIKKVLFIALLSFLLFLSVGEIPLYKIYAAVIFFFLLLGLTYFWDTLVEKWLRNEDKRATQESGRLLKLAHWYCYVSL